MGFAFGIISFLQCFGIIGFSGMGAVLVEISPFLCFLQRVVSRVAVGFFTALVYRMIRNRANAVVAGSITGFCAAFFNTLLFMSSLVLLFGQTEYMQNLIAGRSIIMYIIAAVGINAVVEMVVAAILTGAVSLAIQKAGFIE